MPRIFASLSMAAILLASINVSANASQACLSGEKPYALTDDIVDWTMSIAPGADCIQGLRWSTMRIDLVSVVGAPKSGKVVVVGSGFRYFADPGFHGSDSFTVVVSGKNLKTPGNSILHIEVKAREPMQVSSAQKID
ncbi:MAG: hypothetical protein KGL35_28845 [Bradyrhizobium sp.]|uniref:Ig-like domain-containing protein n=1 Tax=Bradyrhizobium sp. TaxID=376 RepID=UPI001C287662|nr:Ig-like domain-containing protein [Bradyrhizobium sp.]MBU6461110.1 hypothetical protein [Pseudomonadota bacterium]MDE2066187.1 hypothetical protein [Bradyrhizobium sp.]MDE2472626.1 hypothetical protein [Bradyrhizobium sp.]